MASAGSFDESDSIDVLVLSWRREVSTAAEVITTNYSGARTRTQTWTTHTHAQVRARAHTQTQTHKHKHTHTHTHNLCRVRTCTFSHTRCRARGTELVIKCELYNGWCALVRWNVLTCHTTHMKRYIGIIQRGCSVYGDGVGTDSTTVF